MTPPSPRPAILGVALIAGAAGGTAPAVALTPGSDRATVAVVPPSVQRRPVPKGSPVAVERLVRRRFAQTMRCCSQRNVGLRL